MLVVFYHASLFVKYNEKYLNKRLLSTNHVAPYCSPLNSRLILCPEDCVSPLSQRKTVPKNGARINGIAYRQLHSVTLWYDILSCTVID